MNAVSVSSFRESLPEMLKRVESTHEALLLTRHGKVVAKLVPADDRDEPTTYALRGKPISISSDFDDSMDVLIDAVLESEL